MSAFLSHPVDFERHNQEVRQVWSSFEAGKPVRVPLSIVGSITNYFANPELNTHHFSYEQFFTDPEVQIQAQLEYQYWQRHHILCDHEMGLPDHWQLNVDFQNSYDASWCGCPLQYMDRQLPDTLPILAQDKNRLDDFPDLLPVDGGLIGRGIEFYEYMVDYCKTHEFHGRPILPPQRYLGEGTDGVLDLAYKLRGAENILLDMYEDEDYYRRLMEYLTRNLIRRMRALREKRWAERPDSEDCGIMRSPSFGFADDAITMISAQAYREFVYPYHRQLVDAFSDGEGCSIHLCGANMQHFEQLHRLLNVNSFDTGFPIDLGKMRRQVGPQSIIRGGPTVMLLRNGPVQAIAEEARRILNSGVADSGRFIMIAANNLAPLTPVEHIEALYKAVRSMGIYPLEKRQ